MDEPSKQPGLPWRRISWLTLWLSLIPPLGLWMLWREPSLTTRGKIRLLFYMVMIPLLVYLAITVYSFTAIQRAVGAY